MPSQRDTPADAEYPDDGNCHQCSGEGFIIVCIDDLCHGQGACIHGDGEEVCPTCGGEG